MAKGTRIGPFLIAPFPARKNWKVEIHKSVFGKTKRRFFKEESAAILWASEQNRELETGKPVSLDTPDGDEAGSVKVLVTSYLADRKGEVTPEQLKLAKNHLLKFSGRFGGLKADDVDPLTCRNWIKGLPLAQRTKHGIFTTCRTAYRWGMRYDFATRSPFERMEPIPKGEATKAILTPAQMEMLLEQTMPVYVRAWLVLGGFCGLRPAEIYRSDWSAVDWKAAEFHVTKDAIKRDRMRQRGLRERIVEMPEAALRLLPRGETGPIVPVSANTFQVHVSRLAAKLAGKDVGKGAEWPHDCLRHSAATYMLAIKGDAGPVAKWLGHTTTKMVHDNYTRDVPKRVAVKWWAMGLPDGGENVISIAA